MLDLKTIHLIKDKNQFLLFHYPSFSLISLNKITGNILQALIKNNSLEYISQIYMVTKEEIYYCLSQIENVLCKNYSQIRIPIEEKNIVNRITLHVSNDCNLKCKYCYANGGNYSMHRGYMNRITAEQFVNFCVKSFNYIEKIVFFGGEPCLNIDIMEYVCQKFEQFYLRKEIAYIPKFVIITNGTILNKKLLDFIKKYISFITVSIDGMEYLNDYNRIDLHGNGSFKRAASFIDTIKQNTNVHLQYEATYTNYHLDKHISKTDIRRYMSERFDISGIIVNDENIKYQNKIDDIGISKEKLDCNNLPICFYHILKSLTFKEPLYFCPIATKQFAVSTTGEIFPCHMDVGNKSLCLGSIFNYNIFNNLDIQNSFPLYKDIYNKKFLCCKVCWAQNLCESCSRLLFYNKQTKKYDKEPNPGVCTDLKNNIERILISIARLRENKTEWQQFVKNNSRLI